MEKEIDTYELYLQDESGFENAYPYDDKEEAIAKAIKLWNEGDGGYAVVAVYASDGERLWYMDHHMQLLLK